MTGTANRQLKIILTGSTGMVGEGVLLRCLEHPAVERVLGVSRRPYPLVHPKWTELLVPDFTQLDAITDQMTGYDACFYCAGITSRGLDEASYTRITYDIPLHFARTVAAVNPGLVLCHISGNHADGTGASRMMWARVKGQAENDLLHVGCEAVYNFRPGIMRPTPGQRSIKPYMRTLGLALFPVLRTVLPNHVSTLEDVGTAMIRCVLQGYPKSTLEIRNINALAAS